MESTITGKLATNSSKLFETYQFLTLNYWFGTPNELNWAQLAPFEIISTLVFILSLAVAGYKLFNQKLSPPDHKFLGRVFWLTLFFGPVGWFLIFLRHFGVVFLSARFLWLIWFGLLFWAAFYLYRFYAKKLPAAKQTYAAYHLKKRYFPKKKKK